MALPVRGRLETIFTFSFGSAAAANEPAANEPFKGARTTFADAYVPSGTNAFSVAEAKGFAVGDAISIRRPTTADWVKFMGMDTLNRNGDKQTWIGLSRAGTQERKITAIDGNRITIDVPLSDSYDAKYLGASGVTVTKLKPAAGVSNVGIEHLAWAAFALGAIGVADDVPELRPVDDLSIRPNVNTRRITQESARVLQIDFRVRFRERLGNVA